MSVKLLEPRSVAVLKILDDMDMHRMRLSAHNTDSFLLTHEEACGVQAILRFLWEAKALKLL